MVDQTTNQARRVYVVNGPAAGTPTGATGSAGQADVAAPIEQARNYLYQGGLWVPANAKANGWQGVALLRSSDGQEVAYVAGTADGQDGNAQQMRVVNEGYISNGATWDRQRGNTEGTLLASAARTATTSSPNQTNYNARGVHLYLNITANPGGAEQLFLSLMSVDPISGSAGEVFEVFAPPAATSGLYELQIYPGVATTFNGARAKGKSLAIPRTFFARVSPSGGGSWTYSLGYSLIV